MTRPSSARADEGWARQERSRLRRCDARFSPGLAGKPAVLLRERGVCLASVHCPVELSLVAFQTHMDSLIPQGTIPTRGGFALAAFSVPKTGKWNQITKGSGAACHSLSHLSRDRIKSYVIVF